MALPPDIDITFGLLDTHDTLCPNIDVGSVKSLIMLADDSSCAK